MMSRMLQNLTLLRQLGPAIVIAAIFIDTVGNIYTYHNLSLTYTGRAKVRLIQYQDEFKKVLAGLLDPSRIDPRYIYTAVLEFKTQSGEVIKFYDGPFKNQKKYKPGVEYDIQYNPAKPIDLFFTKNALSCPRILFRLAIILILADWMTPNPVTIQAITGFLSNYIH